MMNDITREDAVKWLTNLRDDCGRHQDMWHYAEALDQIIELLSTDVAPVVRCKDCNRRYITGSTTHYYVCDFMDAEYNDNGYCHHGERKDDE